jgi:anaerobic ribonucleoside-triphosphate reductase activating protein
VKLQVNRVAHPVTVLGPGRRVGLWVQGCRIGCPGCGSTDTWDPAGGKSVDTAVLAAELADLVAAADLTGLTITGGEPTEQSDALADLVVRLRAAVPDRQIDVLVFTGRSVAAARRRAALWAVADVAVCGPYRPDRPSAEPLVATANQRLVTLTPLGRERLADLGAPRRLQANVADGHITLVGMPGPGDLPRLEEALRRRGVTLGGRSGQTP